MPSVLVSALSQQFKLVDIGAFRTAYPYDWLVWEPGPWKPVGTATVMAPTPVALAAATGQGGAVAFTMTARDGSTAQVTLGRAVSCDLVLNDGTLSSLHLVFMLGPAGWTVRDAGSRNGSFLNGGSLEPGKPQPLISTAQLQAGSCFLTYYRPEELLERLRRPTRG